jgi:undecaprenyl pyrophosphate synthase
MDLMLRRSGEKQRRRKALRTIENILRTYLHISLLIKTSGARRLSTLWSCSNTAQIYALDPLSKKPT